MANKRKPITDMVMISAGIDPVNHVKVLRGTVEIFHEIQMPDDSLDRVSEREAYNMKRDTMRRIRNAIDDQVFGDARMVLMRLADEVGRLIGFIPCGVPLDAETAPVINRVEILLKELKEELN
jgi:hypothetical protein